MAGVPAAASAAPTWTKAVTLAPSGRESAPPQIAVTPKGEAVAVWQGGRPDWQGGRPDGIQVASRRPGGGWMPPVTLMATRGPGEPDVVATARKAVVVWTGPSEGRRGGGSAVFAATRLPGGRWSRPKNISAERQGYHEPEGREPQVAITRRGEAIAMWTAHDERHATNSFIRTAAQPLGGSWSSPVGLPGSVEGEQPLVEVTPKGEAVAIWHADYNEESGLEAASRSAEGKWSAVKRLSHPGSIPRPQLAMTSKGEAVAIWRLEGEGRDLGLQVATRKPGLPWKVRTFASSEGEGFSFPEIATGPGGTAAVTWTRSLFSAGEEEVVVARHPPSGEWTQPARLFGDELQLPKQMHTKLAVSDRGEWIAVWQSFGYAPRGSTVEASTRGRGQLWRAPVRLSGSRAAPEYGSQEQPSIAVAPNGEVFALWQFYNGTRWVIQGATRK
jgi:hypothetical protein